MSFTVIPGGKIQQGNTIPIEYQLSTKQAGAFREVFGTVTVGELVPDLTKNPISFSLEELLWFCVRATKSQFLCLENTLTGINHSLQSHQHLGLRILFENIICRLKDSHDVPPQPMSPENQVVYNYVIGRFSQVPEAKNRTQSGILHLIPNNR